MSFISRHIAAVAIACTATLMTVAGAAGPAQAGPAESAKISFRGLDLADPAGQAVLEARLRQAAKAVCGVNDAFDLQARQASAACYRSALADAAPKVQMLAERARAERLAAAPSAVTSNLR